jgi:hypothetical protein
MGRVFIRSGLIGGGAARGVAGLASSAGFFGVAGASGSVFMSAGFNGGGAGAAARFEVDCGSPILALTMSRARCTSSAVSCCVARPTGGAKARASSSGETANVSSIAGRGGRTFSNGERGAPARAGAAGGGAGSWGAMACVLLSRGNVAVSFFSLSLDALRFGGLLRSSSGGTVRPA